MVGAWNLEHLFTSGSRENGFLDFWKKWFLGSLNFFFSKSIIFRCSLVKPTSFMVDAWNFAHLLTSGSEQNIFLRFFENVLFGVSKKILKKYHFSMFTCQIHIIHGGRLKFCPSTKLGVWGKRFLWFLEKVLFGVCKKFSWKVVFSIVKPTLFMVGAWNIAHLLTSGTGTANIWYC